MTYDQAARGRLELSRDDGNIIYIVPGEHNGCVTCKIEAELDVAARSGGKIKTLFRPTGLNIIAGMCPHGGPGAAVDADFGGGLVLRRRFYFQRLLPIDRKRGGFTGQVNHGRCEGCAGVVGVVAVEHGAPAVGAGRRRVGPGDGRAMFPKRIAARRIAAVVGFEVFRIYRSVAIARSVASSGVRVERNVQRFIRSHRPKRHGDVYISRNPGGGVYRIGAFFHQVHAIGARRGISPDKAAFIAVYIQLRIQRPAGIRIGDRAGNSKPVGVNQ